MEAARGREAFPPGGPKLVLPWYSAYFLASAVLRSSKYALRASSSSASLRLISSCRRASLRALGSMAASAASSRPGAGPPLLPGLPPLDTPELEGESSRRVLRWWRSSRCRSSAVPTSSVRCEDTLRGAILSSPPAAITLPVAWLPSRCMYSSFSLQEVTRWGAGGGKIALPRFGGLVEACCCTTCSLSASLSAWMRRSLSLAASSSRSRSDEESRPVEGAGRGRCVLLLRLLPSRPFCCSSHATFSLARETYSLRKGSLRHCSVEGLCLGFLLSRLLARSRRSGEKWEGMGRCSPRMILSTRLLMSVASKACFPLIISYRQQPRDHMSLLKSYGMLDMTSGDM
mmetsp:Transcript_17043/g.36818  ORF Transcript_17043/g.36818 Transcript_17043/m.36818 type:complete len:344 (+) Transcript_17043:1050-2081(+)